MPSEGLFQIPLPLIVDLAGSSMTSVFVIILITTDLADCLTDQLNDLMAD